MNILYIFWLFAFFSLTCSYADLTEHLKKAEGKSSDHTMRNIDFIYMINLDKRPEKYNLSIQYLDKYGIKPYRFSAVNGWELTIEAINAVGLKFKTGMAPLLATTYPVEMKGKVSSHEWTREGKTYFVHCMSRGAIGCALSHISILQDAYESGYKTIWVMEDDIEVIQDPRILSDLIEELDATVGYDNWDVLFTDYDYRIGVGKYQPAYGAAKRPDLDNRPEERFSDKYMKTKTINRNFRTVAARFGTTSMIIRRSGIIKLLKFAKEHQVYLPYDLDNYLAPGLKRYGLNYDVVTNLLNSLTDIAGPGYLLTQD